MIENSSAGLEMLPGEAYVTVSHEKHHQYALARYRVAPGERRHVAVELGWCTIRAGRHRGESAIEVRLDGRPVGELTFLMSRRYAPVVKEIVEGGGRPGCEAVVQRTTKGLSVMLRLPRSVEATAPASTLVGPPVVANRPARRRGVRPGWVAAGIVAVLAMVAVVGFTTSSTSSNGTAGGGVTATTGPDQAAPASTTTAGTTTTPGRSTSTAPTTTRRTATPVPPRTTTPSPAPRPAPAPTCDPNYRGGCVPVASDVDCAGRNNGPVFVPGPIRVVGTDVHHLDPNKDGVACE
ncbi:hypothetical protein [Actinophytocola sp.]|uniref:hypothetical protein n=1 Tax=Actinophytocola sp. TaxID=1872138 RepID=UPI003D6A5C83